VMGSRAIARATASDYEWDMLPSVACTASDPLMAEISEFRGRILYANGRRPIFRKEGGRHTDEDLLDPGSFHITARRDGDLVGYTRIRPLPEYSQSSLRLLMTRRQFDASLEEMRLTRNHCLEVSRWIVAPCARGTDVGATLVVGAWAIGRRLRKRRLIATVGTRDGQVKMLARFGGQTLNSVEAKFIGDYDDELVALYFELNHPPPRVAAKLNKVERLLRLCH
jgi:hypothetical protein